MSEKNVDLRFKAHAVPSRVSGMRPGARVPTKGYAEAKVRARHTDERTAHLLRYVYVRMYVLLLCFCTGVCVCLVCLSVLLLLFFLLLFFVSACAGFWFGVFCSVFFCFQLMSWPWFYD